MTKQRWRLSSNSLERHEQAKQSKRMKADLGEELWDVGKYQTQVRQGVMVVVVDCLKEERDDERDGRRVDVDGLSRTRRMDEAQQNLS